MTNRDAGDFGGYRFTDANLLEQALTHRSAGMRHNERLEFLGDALLNLFVAQALYEHWPQADEGALTRARAELVRESTLAAIARAKDLGARLVLGPGELKSGGQRRDSILADAFEAVVAAIYFDSDFDTCGAVVLSWFAEAIAALPPPHKVGKDAKTLLHEWLQARQRPLPRYQPLAEIGEDHAKRFRVRCELLDAALTSEGEANSRRAAEQAAAEGMLVQLTGSREQEKSKARGLE